MKWLFISLLLFMLGTQTIAQEPSPTDSSSGSEIPAQLGDVVSAEFNSTSLTPLIGEPITIMLAVSTPENVLVVDWPEFEELWGDFSVLDVTERKPTMSDDGITTFTQTLDVRLWKTGDIRTPETFITYQTLEDDETFSVPVRPLFFTVPSVLETTDLNQLALKPDAPLIGMYYVPLWVIMAGICSVVALGFGGRRLWQRWQAQRTGEEDIIPPLERLYNLLNTIPAGTMEPLEAFALIVNGLQRYLAESYDAVTLDMTHEEMLKALNQDDGNHALRLDDLERILDQGALVKYASATPSEQNIQRLIEVTQKWLIDTQEPEPDE